ncbi:Gypsy retrotransposon integrase-like protein 1 [Elysia marginata]|uniref:Gypsy retrotransposon integrase-like protein 1 n=1 Tax=Elysia marginata TaxID=1093978 RepID=A0AAV4FCK7_9GAST|nr:Gypsy retrotransposon integrase-like protein 1 [Elysia marginata]
MKEGLCRMTICHLKFSIKCGKRGEAKDICPGNKIHPCSCCLRNCSRFVILRNIKGIRDKPVLHSTPVVSDSHTDKSDCEALVVTRAQSKNLESTPSTPSGCDSNITDSDVLSSFTDIDVKKYVRSCHVCQIKPRTGHDKPAPLQRVHVVEEPFQRVNIDIVGPLPVSEDRFEYLLTMVDVATRCAEAVPLRRITATDVAESLFQIFCRLGFPLEIQSDRGQQFMSHLLAEFNKLCGIKHYVSTQYLPQTNGVVERGDHAASDRNCPKFLEEKAILHYRAHHGGTFQQARAAVVVEVAREVQARSFATVERKGPTKLGEPQIKKSIHTTPAPAKAAPPKEKLARETTLRDRGTIEKTPTARFGTQPDVPLGQIDSIWETPIEKITPVGRTISPHPSPSPPLPPSIARDECDMDADLGAALGEASPKYPSTQNNIVNENIKV